MNAIDRDLLIETINKKYPKNALIKKDEIIKDIENMKNMRIAKGYSRLGKVVKNMNGTPMQVIKDINTHDVEIQFLDEFGYKKICAYHHFINGKVKNPYDRTKLGVGYLGEQTLSVDKKIYKKAYDKWSNMLDRCYTNRPYRTYIHASVCEEWHNFQNFLSWFLVNYFEDEDDSIELDKDIIKKDNKTYSSDTCILVPREINRAVIRKKFSRNELPIGVNYRSDKKKYIASHSNVKIGTYNTAEEAFKAYKNYVENRLLFLANKYKDKMPERTYKAIINYRVEEND